MEREGVLMPTPRQTQILEYIQRHTNIYGVPPTIREIAKGVGVSSTNAIAEQVRRLVEAGFLKKNPRSSRGLFLTEKSLFKDRIPILGKISAGKPIFAQENLEGYLNPEEILIRDQRDCFILRIKGDSMVGDGILDGDFIIVRKTQVAEQGQIVVALIDEDATVKRYYRKDNKILLVPSNPAYQPIEISSDGDLRFEIIGVVTGVFRRY